MVDDAIVVGESIHHHREELGFDAEEAAIKGASAVARPVVFAVLTTVVAFAPWAFLSGSAKRIPPSFIGGYCFCTDVLP